MIGVLGNFGIEAVKLHESVLDSDMVGFVELVNRVIEEGRSQSTLPGQGEGKSRIGIGLPNGSSSAVNGRYGVHVTIKHPEGALLGALGIEGPNPC